MRTFKQRKITVGENITINDTIHHYFEMVRQNSKGLKTDSHFSEKYFSKMHYRLTRMCVFDTELFKILFAKGGI